jgi:hypothetical protein
MIKVDLLTAGVLLRALALRLQILPANEKLRLAKSIKRIYRKK